MVTWPEAIDRIRSPDSGDLDIHRKRFGGLSKTPLIVTGSSGAGKTRLWCRLTGQSRPDISSLATDDGYVLTPQRQTLTLTTVPGQDSKTRFFALEEFFGSQTKLAGIIFVASNGRDRIWQQNADLVANELDKFDMANLAERNRREELANFTEVTERIIQKSFVAPEKFRPQWLLVAVNKLDLYLDQESEVLDYYRMGSGSRFDGVAQDLIRRIGTNSIKYLTVPLAVQSSDYIFDSSLGRLTETSQLTSAQCTESVACLLETLGDLCEQSAQ